MGLWRHFPQFSLCLSIPKVYYTRDSWVILSQDHQGHVCLLHLTENWVNLFSKGKFCWFRNKSLCQKYQNSNFPNNSERCLPGHFTYCYLRSYTVKKRVPGPGGGRLCVGKLFTLCGWCRTWWKLSNCRALCEYAFAPKNKQPPCPSATSPHQKKTFLNDFFHSLQLCGSANSWGYNYQRSIFYHFFFFIFWGLEWCSPLMKVSIAK